MIIIFARTKKGELEKIRIRRYLVYMSSTVVCRKRKEFKDVFVRSFPFLFLFPKIKALPHCSLAVLSLYLVRFCFVQCMFISTYS